MLLFRSEDHLDRWCSFRDMQRGGVLSLEQAWRLARAWYAKKLSPDWRRHTLEESEALLSEIGLTGQFWNLRGA
jgi:hypothetical protein